MFVCIGNFGLNISIGTATRRLQRNIRNATTILCCVVAQQTTAQEIGKLYAPRPPAGYAFVRVALANAAKKAANVQIDSSEAPIGDTAVASRYRAMKADKPVRISVGDAVIEEKIVPLADQFSTIVIARNGSSWTSYVIDEGQGSSSDLKAQLRFFNLVPGCEASLKVADGPVIFEPTPTKSVRSRAINPVQARLEASCNGRGAAFTLPQLHAGDHFSIFLTEGAEAAIGLSGQFDETEPYTGR